MKLNKIRRIISSSTSTNLIVELQLHHLIVKFQVSLLHFNCNELLTKKNNYNQPLTQAINCNKLHNNSVDNFFKN